MKPFAVNVSGRRPDDEFYATFITIGGESRCTHFAETKPSAEEKIAYVYEADPCVRFPQHRTRAHDLGYTELLSSQDNHRSFVRELLIRASKSKLPRIAVDISSMTRGLMAIWAYALLTTAVEAEVDVIFFYSHAKFSPPPSRVPLAKELTPITPEFAGMFADSTAPILLILGLGYEPQLALSFLEYLEPAKLVVFEPAHHELEYTRAIQESNAVFFRTIRNTPVHRYNVYSPYTLFQDIEGTIQGAAYESRVHIAPYGTKLFAICGLLAAGLHYPKVFVWNLNPIQTDDAHDRISNGKISHLSARVRRPVA